MRKRLVVLLLLGLLIPVAFAQEADKAKPRFPGDQPPARPKRSAAPEESRPAFRMPPERPLPAATARMVLIRFVIAQVTLRDGQQLPVVKSGAPGGAAGEAAAAKPPILAMPEESLFDIERLNKELQAERLDLRAGRDKIRVWLSDKMMKDRVVEIIQHGQLTTLDEQRAYVLVGQMEPRITGVSLTSFGRTYSETFENHGMQAVFTPRIEDSGRISLQVDLTKSQLGPVEAGGVIAEPKDGEKIRVPGTEMMSVQSTITAAPGQAVALAGVNTRRDARRTEFLVLVSAELLDRN